MLPSTHLHARSDARSGTFTTRNPRAKARAKTATERHPRQRRGKTPGKTYFSIAAVIRSNPAFPPQAG
jgi:hypothetical protein